MQEKDAMSQADFNLCSRIARLTRQKKLPELRKSNIRALLLATELATKPPTHQDGGSNHE
jgi:hypothetical protein